MGAKDVAELGNLINEIIDTFADTKPEIHSDILAKGATLFTWKKQYLHEQDILLPPGWDIKEIKLVGNILGVTLDDGAEHTYVIDKPGGVEQLQKLLRQSGARQWDMLKKPKTTKLNWAMLEAFYEKHGAAVIKDYILIHDQMLKQLETQIVNLLTENPDIDAINIIDAGCGQSPELVIRAQELINKIIKKHAGHPITVKALGFEYVQGNVDVCHKKMAAMTGDLSTVKIMQGNSNNIEHIVKEDKTAEKDKHLAHTPRTHNIILSSGTITRMALHNAFEALNVLQSSWRAPASKIVIGGEQDLLLVEIMLKRIGFSIKNYVALSGHLQPVLSLERIPLPVMVNEAIEQMRIHLTKPQAGRKLFLPLDLSMHPSPELMLAGIAKGAPHLAKDMTTLDLSFACIENLTTDSFRDFPSLREVKFNSHDPVAIGKLLAIMPPTIELKIKYTKNEIFLFESEKNLRSIGHGELVDEKSALYEPVNLVVSYVQSLLPDNKKQAQLLYDYFVKKIEDYPLLFNKELSLERILKKLSHLAAYEKNAELVAVFNALKIPATMMEIYSKMFASAQTDRIKSDKIIFEINDGLRVAFQLAAGCIERTLTTDLSPEMKLKYTRLLTVFQKISSILEDIVHGTATQVDIDYLNDETVAMFFNSVDALYQEEQARGILLLEEELSLPDFFDFAWQFNERILPLHLMPSVPEVKDLKPNEVYVYLDKDKNLCYMSMRTFPEEKESKLLNGRLEGSAYQESASMLRYLLASQSLPTTYIMDNLFLTAMPKGKAESREEQKMLWSTAHRIEHSLHTYTPPESAVQSLFDFFIKQNVFDKPFPKPASLMRIIEKIGLDLPKPANDLEKKKESKEEKKESKEEKRQFAFFSPATPTISPGHASSSMSSRASSSSSSLNKKR